MVTPATYPHLLHQVVFDSSTMKMSLLKDILNCHDDDNFN